jgi:hypothetical protein
MNLPHRIVVRCARHSEEPGAGGPLAGMMEGDAGRAVFLR